MSRVKIVATIGPRTEEPDVLRQLRSAGMDIARLNGAHADLEWHERTIANLRGTVPDVPILLDLPGRKVRTERLDRELVFAAQDTVVFTTDRRTASSGRVRVNYPRLHVDVRVGDSLLVDDGTIRFTVTDIQDRDLACRAENAGSLRDPKGVQVPGRSLRTEFLSDRDRQLIGFAVERDVDFIGVSFVETRADVESVRELVGGRAPAIVSKIESQEALDNLEELIGTSDALMIDRGDLSVETAMESIALHQKRILAEARKAACPVIVATEILHSMIHSPTPTKAEIGDITSMVLDQAAALMLSGETAVGDYAVDAVSVMRRVADVASDYLQTSLAQGKDSVADSVPQAMGDAIGLICHTLSVTKIVAITISGYAAQMVAARMPSQPILAVTNDARAARRFNLMAGTTGVYVDVPFSRTSMEHIPSCLEVLWRRGELLDEDLILVTAVGYPKSGNRMNLIETHKVADLVDSLGWVR